jgi:hypothetical protein
MPVRSLKVHLSMKLVSAALLVLFMGGCSKKEEPIEQPGYTSLQLKAITVDALMLQVMANETILTDSLYTPGSKAVQVTFFDPVHRFRVTDLFSKTLLLDTTVQYKTGAVNAITFFQSVSGGKLFRIGPPANEPLPTAGKIKLSVIYGIPDMPDITKVVVEDSKDGTSTYEATDSFQLKKGEFSSYFTGNLKGNRKPQLRFYTADARRKLIAKADPATFSNTNAADFTIYSLNGISGTDANGVFFLSREKLY